MTAPAGKLLYVGPVNMLVARMKAFSIASSAAATAAAPALVHYSPVAEAWTHSAKLGLLGGVLATSYATTWLFHRLIRKYVYSVRLVADSTSHNNSHSHSHDNPLLALETPSLLGRRRCEQVPMQDLCGGDSIFCTWKRTTGPGSYLIQFIPKADQSPEQNGNRHPKTFRNETIDWEAFEKVFSDIASRQ